MGTRTHLPPYAALAEKLRGLVAAQALPPGSRLGTEVALAEENGISRMTARRAVQALVDDGLVERRAGRGVFVRKAAPAPRVVRFVAGNLLWDPAVRVAHGVQEDAGAAGFEVSVFDGRGDLAAVLEELRALPGSGFAGAIVMSQHTPEFTRSLFALAEAGYPFVVVDQTLAEPKWASVSSDNRAGGRLAAETLLAAGHRRLAFLGDLAADTTAARAKGAADACDAVRVTAPVVFDLPGERFADWEPAIRDRIGELLRLSPAPTAIVCSCDSVARFALRALAARGVTVPDEMSITGFDDDPIAEWTTPALTTMRQDFAEMGRRALSLLGARLAGEPPRHEDVPVDPVARASVAAPQRRADSHRTIASSRHRRQ